MLVNFDPSLKISKRKFFFGSNACFCLLCFRPPSSLCRLCLEMNAFVFYWSSMQILLFWHLQFVTFLSLATLGLSGFDWQL